MWQATSHFGYFYMHLGLAFIRWSLSNSIYLQDGHMIQSLVHRR